MAQMRKLACDGIRTNSRGEPQVPLVSARQEILTSLVSALDSVVGPGARLCIYHFVSDILVSRRLSVKARFPQFAVHGDVQA